MNDEIQRLKHRIAELEAELKVQKFLNDGRYELRDRWERALRHYARGKGDKSPTVAREALGICEFWDSGFGEQKHGVFQMKLRRMWRRFKERLTGPCC